MVSEISQLFGRPEQTNGRKYAHSAEKRRKEKPQFYLFILKSILC